MNPILQRRFRNLKQNFASKLCKPNEIHNNQWLSLNAVLLFWET